VCSGIAIASALLAMAFLPGRTVPAEPGDSADVRVAPSTSLLDESRMTP
jgi:hypothetical protein